MTHTLFANTDYMDWIVKQLKAKGQLWAWANVGWERKKKLWRIK